MFYSEFNKNLFNSDYRIILYNLCLKDGQEKCNKNYLSLNTPFKIKIKIKNLFINVKIIYKKYPFVFEKSEIFESLGAIIFKRGMAIHYEEIKKMT